MANIICNKYVGNGELYIYHSIINASNRYKFYFQIMMWGNIQFRSICIKVGQQLQAKASLLLFDAFFIAYSIQENFNELVYTDPICWTYSVSQNARLVRSKI